MKSSYEYRTGINPLDRSEAASPLGFTRYARAKLGCEAPFGAQRGVWYKQLKMEMEAQGFSWEELINTVDYLHERQITIRRIYYVFYHVRDARLWKRDMEVHNLQAKVSAVLAEEEDVTWVRRLSLAKGKALQRVYIEWMKAHGVEVRG